MQAATSAMPVSACSRHRVDYGVLLCVLSVFLLAPLASYAQTKYPFDLPAQPLAESLRAVGHQTSTNVMFEPRLVKGLDAPALRAETTPAEAIRLLLAGTKLTALQTAADTILIRHMATAEKSPTTGRAVAPPGTNGDTRLAQATPGSNAPGAETGNAAKPSRSDAEAIDIEEIVVTGSHIRRSRESLTGALNVLTAEDLARTGQPTIDRALQRLPQNFAGQSDSRDVDPFAGNSMGGGGVNLRGLGADSTLVLVNGRRIVRDGAGGSFTDISSIPMVAIERVEVLTEGASAVYGADAVGGVVNLILKNDFSGSSFQGRYGASTEEGYDEQSASLFAGLSGERFRLSGAYSYSRQSDLLYEQREFVGNGDYRAQGGTDFTSRNASPGTITAVDGNINSLAALAGQPVTIVAVPAGINGRNTTVSQYLSGVGSENRLNTLGVVTLVPEQQRHSLFLTGSWDVTERLQIYGDAVYTDRRTVRQSPYVSTPAAGSVVPATNPYNPFGEPVRVNYAFTDLGVPDFIGTSKTFNVNAGVKGRLLSTNWSFDANGAVGREDVSFRNGPLLNFAAFTPALSATNEATAVNLFGDGTGNDAALLGTLIGFNYLDGRSDMKNASLILEGPLLALPAGESRLSVGGELRREEIETHQTLTSVVPALVRDRNGGRDSKAAFVELLIPVLDGANRATPADASVDILTAELAGRIDDQDDFDSKFTYKLGVVYRPIQQLAFRVAYNTAFKAPLLRELNEPVVSTGALSAVFDPARNETAQVQITNGGNPDLEPEEAQVWSAGLFYELRALAGLGIGLNAFAIDYDDRVIRPSSAFILQNEAALPGRVVRGTPSAADQAAGRPGPLLAVDSRSLNVAGLKTSGVDVNLRFRRETSLGALSAELMSTYVDSYEVKASPVAQPQELVNVTGNPSRSKSRLSFGYSRSAWSGNLSVNYLAARRDATSAAPIDSYATVDGGLSTQFSVFDSAGTISLGVVNLLDRQPPFVNVNGGFDPLIADPRGRVIYISLQADF